MEAAWVAAGMEGARAVITPAGSRAGNNTNIEWVDGLGL